MFSGEKLRTIDAKGRVVLPSRYRDEFKVGDDPDAPRRCVVAKGKDRQLVVYPMAKWQEEADAVMALPSTKENRRLQRAFFGGADEQVLDRQGRLLLNQDLRAFAGIEPSSDVYLVGVHDHVEVWNKDRYDVERELDTEEYVEEEDDHRGGSEPTD